MNMRKMKVDKLGIDLLTHDPVVILKDTESEKQLPILIGPFEATAIALALEGTKVPRPLSHDLMKGMVDLLNAEVDRVVIHDIQDNTFFAKVVIKSKEGTVEVDSRPSDAIALALRADADIYVSNNIVLDEDIDMEEQEKKEVDNFKKFLEDLKPSDFTREE